MPYNFDGGWEGGQRNEGLKRNVPYTEIVIVCIFTVH